LDIRATVLPQAIDEPSPFVRRRRDGLWGAKARLHPPKESPPGTVRVVHSPGGEAQGDGDARRPGAYPSRQPRATRHFVLGTQPEPAPAGFHARPPGHVRPDLAEDDQGRAFFDPLHRRQVDTGQAIERGAGIKPRCVGFLMSAGLGG